MKRADFAGFAAGFYAEHEAFLAEALAPSLRALAVVSRRPIEPTAWAAATVARSRAELGAADDVESLLASWESAKPQSLLESLS